MDLLGFFKRNYGKKIRVFMRRDASSAHIPEVFECVLRYYDIRSGFMLVEKDGKSFILDNRGARSFIEFEEDADNGR